MRENRARLTGAAVAAWTSAAGAFAQVLPPSAGGPQSTRPVPFVDDPAPVGQLLEDGTGMADVVVTTPRTGETCARATPIGITVLSAGRLNASRGNNVKGLVQLTPGLNVAQVTASAAIYIGGVGSNNVFAPDGFARSLAVFAQRTCEFTRRLSAVAGMRHTSGRKTITTASDGAALSGLDGSPCTVALQLTRNW